MVSKVDRHTPFLGSQNSAELPVQPLSSFSSSAFSVFGLCDERKGTRNSGYGLAVFCFVGRGLGRCETGTALEVVFRSKQTKRANSIGMLCQSFQRFNRFNCS